MGLLTVGTPLSWEETQRYADHVRYHGIKQLINLYHRLKDRTNDCLYFGDEVEYTLVTFDPEKTKATVTLKAQHYLEEMGKLQAEGKINPDVTFAHEYASYVIEGIPGKPYGALSAHFNTVEEKMAERRRLVHSLLDSSNETILSITVFPRIGCPSFTTPDYPPQPQTSVSRSLFFPDEAINNSHPRFKSLTTNIRQRRGEKVAIHVPIYVDTNTPQPFVEDLPAEGSSAMKPDHIYMDCMGFGMGLSCLQMTFQACNITEARHLYDQLTPITPIVMALSAASPIYRGYLADVDHRWSVIAASVDDRTAEERGLKPLKNNKFVLNKSRYDSIDSYLSPEGRKYNDIRLTCDEDIVKELMENGFDEQLARHFAHLFVRDTISLFKEKVGSYDDTDTDHFENIQSTNWQTMRFKPPPANSSIGWRVEFRPTECQLTDFENAAFTVFVVMLTRVILSYNLNLLIPISKVDENVKRAQKRDAVLTEKFYFRTNVTTSCSPPDASECVKKGQCPGIVVGNTDRKLSSSESCPYAFQELTINEIMNGKEDKFTGLIPFIRDYMDNIEVDVDTRCSVSRYLDFLSKRASGELMTTAKYLREFVRNHPDYKHDSVISEEINYDLLKRCDHISKGLVPCPELLLAKESKSRSDIPKAVLVASTADRKTRKGSRSRSRSRTPSPSKSVV
ncbi:glutamate--cysteine ligase catalytic subunit-like [Watersipora subatra]|uniref:glutamate--cysteine ligase catalytic subunit-like n=1 Tax=Watersipora subatra TaxID=2589382 RepID=UPI00355B9E25